MLAIMDASVHRTATALHVMPWLSTEPSTGAGHVH